MKKIGMKYLFFGVGAVSVVMARALWELSQKHEIKSVSFVFVVRSLEKARGHFFRNSEILEQSVFVEVKEFETLFVNPKPHKKALSHASVFINTSIPSFNVPIMELALKFGANYADLASDIYNDAILQSHQFAQQSLNESFKNKGRFALINLGISPGVTNFLIGERMAHFHRLPYKTHLKKINIHLLEEITSKELVFSWAPHVAIEEISSPPLYFKGKKAKSLKPFSKAKSYKFPYFQNPITLYPVFQEELISLRQSYPEAGELRMHVGGNEIELMKNLYELNLLSHRYCYQDAQISLNAIIKEVIPKMKTPEVMEQLVREKTITAATFCAVADMGLEVHHNEHGKVKCVESVGVSFTEVTSLLGTPYSGATYISYPTGIGAAVLLFHTLIFNQPNPLNGVLVSEALPKQFGLSLCDVIKRELGTYRLGIFHFIAS